MNDKIHISLIQTDLVWENEQANLNRFDRLLKEVTPETEIIILPEMFATGFTMNVQKFNKPVGYQSFEWMKQKSSELNKIIVGSLLTEDKGKYFNRMYWVRPDGSFEYYDKRHLFHMGGEHKVMTAGNRKVFVSYKNRRFQLQICYDLRFPVWSKNNFDETNGSYDYDAIIYIANWPESRKTAYMSLLKARAIENQAFVIWVNRIGVDGKGIFHSGDSQIIDAEGIVLTSAKSGQEKILNYSLDFSKLDSLRKRFNVGLDWDKFQILT